MFRNLPILCLGLALIGCSQSTPSAGSKAESVNAPSSNTGDAMAAEQLAAVSGIKIQRKNDSIVGIDFRGCPSGWSKSIPIAKKLPKLESLSFSGDEANDEVAIALKEMNNLHTIAFEKSSITNVGLEALKQHSKLRSLKLASSSITDEGLKHLADFSDLVLLSLQECKVTDDGFASLSKLMKLKEAVVFKSDVSSGPLKAFANAPELTKLNLRGTKLTSQDLTTHIEAFKNLQDLEISETNIDDSTLPTLAKMPNLKALNVWRTKVTDQGLEALASMGLTRLNLDDNPAIGDVGMDHVAKMTSLEWLHVGKTKITDAGLAKLETLNKLTELRINDTAVSHESLNQFKQKLPALKTVVH
jgi:Leucine-rich repeat (LRR) protein